MSEEEVGAAVIPRDIVTVASSHLVNAWLLCVIGNGKADRLEKPKRIPSGSMRSDQKKHSKPPKRATAH